MTNPHPRGDARHTMHNDVEFTRQMTHEDGTILCRYHGVEKFRPVRIVRDLHIEIQVGKTWRHAYVDPIFKAHIVK